MLYEQRKTLWLEVGALAWEMDSRGDPGWLRKVAWHGGQDYCRESSPLRPRPEISHSLSKP